MNKLFALALLALAAACGAPQTAPPHPEITTLEVSGWASPSPGGVDVAAGYLTIANGTDAEERLVSLSSPRAASVEIHQMNMDGDVMRMRAIEGGFTIPRGETAFFQPGGMHLMFTGVTQPFVSGESIPVRLHFERAGEMDISLPVRIDGPR